MLRLALCLLLTGCASDGMHIRWEQHDFKTLQEVCAVPGKVRVAGCYKRAGSQCVVMTYRGDKELHDTLGHEVRHCFEGAFH